MYGKKILYSCSIKCRFLIPVITIVLTFFEFPKFDLLVLNDFHGHHKAQHPK